MIVDKLKFRNYLATDFIILKEISEEMVDNLYAVEESYLLYDESEDNLHPELARKRYTLEIEGEVVGFAAIYENYLHLGNLFLGITIAKKWQRMGIGTKTFEKLLCESNDKESFTVKTDLNDFSTINFLKKNHFVLSTKSMTGIIEGHIGLDYLKNAILPSALAIRKGCNKYELAQFFANRYYEDHFWSPCEKLSKSEELTMFMGDNVIEGSVIQIYKDDTLVAASNLMSIEPGEAYWVWYGIDHAIINENLSKQIYQFLLSQSLKFCEENNYKLFFEADSINGEPYFILENISQVQIERGIDAKFDNSFSVWTRKI